MRNPGAGRGSGQFGKGSAFQLRKGRFRLEVRKEFFVRVVRLWHRLSREVVDSWSLAVSKAGLDGAWGNLGSWTLGVTCPWQRK